MKKLTLLIFLILCFQKGTVYAQDFLAVNDLSQIKVASFSDTQILEIKEQLISNNLTIDQAQVLALSKGMPISEFTLLKERIGNIATHTESTVISQISSTQEAIEQQEIMSITANNTTNNRLFGSELFTNLSLTFEPNLKLAVPVNYILGPDDELQISIYGIQEFNTNVSVSVDGKIAIQNVGQISVGGQPLEAVIQNIKKSLSRVYNTLRTGQSQVSVSLSRIRTIKITIIGSQRPGNYSISSLSSVYNALHLAGGPSDNGTYRNIELIRDNKIIQKIDLYRFLVNGDQTDNIGIKENDVIRIPTYRNRVTLEGEVKRPGIFELAYGENLANLLTFASGFTEQAYQASINVIQKTDKELKVKNINASDYITYFPKSGDLFTVSKILDRFENRIIIHGAVFRPNVYSLSPNMTVADLIKQADGLREDAFMSRASLIRIKQDLTREIVNIDLAKALKGDETNNILLQKEDDLTIYSIFDFKDNYSVTIQGEVRRPSSYPYVEGLTLNDLLAQSGGLSIAASKRVEIARMVKSEELNFKDHTRVKLFNIEINPSNNDTGQNFVLEPFDVINVRRVPVFEMPKIVTIKGEVLYPGNYVIANKQERLFDFIERAGGLSLLANTDAIRVRRLIKRADLENLKEINLPVEHNDSLQRVLERELDHIVIPVDWRKLVNDKNGYTNIIIQEGDQIEIGKYEESVSIKGSVLLNSQIVYQKGKNVNYYVNAVGGLNSKAWKRKTYVVYPNGSAATTKSFLFVKSYPDIIPGSQIVIPERPEKKPMTMGELASITGILTTLLAMVILITR